MSQPVRLSISRWLPASPERVFDAWLDPAMARRFLFATPTGEMRQVDIDPQVGGRFVIVERRPGGDAAHHGQYLEIDRPRRLVFTFAAEPDAAGSRVGIDFTASGEGCEVTLEHILDPEWADYAERTRDGWNSILATLASYLETAT